MLRFLNWNILMYHPVYGVLHYECTIVTVPWYTDVKTELTLY
jgi:hypothetical protein